MKEFWGRVWDVIKGGVGLLFDKMSINGEPIYALVVIAIIIAIFIIYDRDDENSKLFSSVAGCFRRFMILFADVMGDIFSIFSSLTEILNLIRILVFGKVDSNTQVFLANYAIIFMSVVSYYTTMSGLLRVIGSWQAILGSFGIQVGILVFSTRLAVWYGNKYKDEGQKEYVYRIKGDCSCKEGEGCLKVVIRQNSKGVNTSKEGMLGICFVICALLLMMMVSSLFSYNAFYGKFVLPTLPLNEYSNARILTESVEEEYSEALKSYQSHLEEIFQKINSIIPSNSAGTANAIDDAIELKNREIERLENEWRDIDERISQVEEDSENYTRYENRLRKIEDDLDENREELDALEEEKLGNDSYTLGNAREQLIAFYRNPLDESISLENIAESWNDMWTSLGEEQYNKLFPSLQKSRLDTLWSNYMTLCQYYREKDYIGFRVDELDQEDFILKKDGESETISQQEQMDEYEHRTRFILENTIRSLEEAPVFDSIYDPFGENVIRGTSKVRLLEELYANYRNNSAGVEELEKALRGLWVLFKWGKSPIEWQNALLTAFTVFLAVFIDSSIVLISVWRGKKESSRSVPELRRLVGILFVKKEEGRREDTRRMQLSVAFGLLFGVLMFIVQQLMPNLGGSLDDTKYWFFFVYCACGLLVAIVIGKAIGRSQKINLQEEPADEGKESEQKVVEDMGRGDIQNVPNGAVEVNVEDKKGQLGLHLFEGVVELFASLESKKICVINKETKSVEYEKELMCIEVEKVKQMKWNIEFAILKSYQLIYVSCDKKHYILTDMLWKLLYSNILDKMSGNILLPISAEDLNYEEMDKNSD